MYSTSLYTPGSDAEESSSSLFSTVPKMGFARIDGGPGVNLYHILFGPALHFSKSFKKYHGARRGEKFPEIRRQFPAGGVDFLHIPTQHLSPTTGRQVDSRHPLCVADARSFHPATFGGLCRLLRFALTIVLYCIVLGASKRMESVEGCPLPA